MIQRIGTKNSIPNSNLIKNVLNSIENGWMQLKMSKSIKNPVVSIIFDQIWLNNRHKDDHFRSFNQKMIENGQI